MKHFFYLAIVISIFSCSSSKEKSAPRQYSMETNRAFEKIEYHSGADYVRPAPPSPPQVKMPAKIVTPSKQKKGEKMTPEMIEINQNLAYFCMKHRKDKRFHGDENKCMNHVTKGLSECQKKYSGAHAKLLSCIKAKLKSP